MSNVPIVCYDCGNSFEALRVTASLRCASCGSSDLDLDDGRHTASGGTGWGKPQPDRLEGWAVQPPGNLPGRNPEAGANLTANQDGVCPACNGSGSDTRASGGGYNEIPCRNCHGTGRAANHTNPPAPTNDPHSDGPPVGGARWATASVPFSLTNSTVTTGSTYTVTPLGTNGVYLSNFTTNSGRKSSDPMGSADEYIRGTDPDYDNRSGESRKADTRDTNIRYRDNHPYSHGNSPLQLKGATCPLSSSNNPHDTQLVRDAKNDAWWHCAEHGPLANVDKNPEINPFDPPANFTPDPTMNLKAARFRKNKDTGKVLKMTHAVVSNNPGLTTGQALTLVRNALLKYPEKSAE